MALALLILTVIPFPHASTPYEDVDFNYSSHLQIPTECTLGSTRIFSDKLKDEQSGRLLEFESSRLVFERESGKEVMEIPTSRFAKVIFTSSSVVCDPTAARVFVNSPVLGIVSAYSSDGDLLWQRELPMFSSAENDKSIDSADQHALYDALAERHSLALSMVGVGEHVVTQYTRGRSRYFQTVIHRSGRIVDTVGPWDGLIDDVEGDRVAFLSEFEVPPSGHVTPQRPTRRTVVTIASEKAEEITHFMAWLFPLPGDDKYLWRQCVGIPSTAIKSRLDAEFDSELSLRAKKRHDDLGPPWWAEVINRAGMPNVLRNPRPQDDSWIRQLGLGLLRVGADVDYWKDETSR